MLRKIIQFSVPSWVGFVINIISVVIITRHFLPDAYGLINTFNATSTFVMGLVCIGLDSGFMRYFFETPDGFDRNRLFLVSSVLPLAALCAISGVLLTVASSWLSEYVFGVDSLFLMLLLFTNVVALLVIRFVTVYYRMEGNTFLYSVLSILVQLALKVPVVLAALVKPDYEFAILATVVASVGMVVCFLLCCGRRLLPGSWSFSLAELKGLRQYFVYSIYTWPVPILLYFNVVITQVIIRQKLGNEAVGIFASVNVFVGLVSVLQAGFSTFWSGYMFEHYQTRAHQIIKMHDYLCFLMIIVMASFVLFRDVMFLLLGSKYQASKPLFALLLLNPLLLILSETTGYGICIAKKSHLMFISTLVSILLNVGVILLSIPVWGLLGACIGSAASGVVLFAMQTYYAQGFYKSIDHIGKTIFAVGCLVMLAEANLLFSYNLLVAVAFGISIIVAAAVVYRREVFEMIDFSRVQIAERIQ